MVWKKKTFYLLSMVFIAAIVQAQDLTLELQMPNRMISPGVTFALDLKITNTGGDYSNAQLFVIFTTGLGDYWFYPGWCNYSEGVDWLDVDIQGNSTKEMNIIWPFAWPEGVGEFQGAVFWSAVLYDGECVSNISKITFCCSSEPVPTVTPAPPTPTPAPGTPTPRPVPTDFVYVPPGYFHMGSEDTEMCHNSNESPIHVVTISKGFYIKSTEVTQGEWECHFGSNPSACVWEGKPVERVTWYDCCVYCNLLSINDGLTPCYYSDASFSRVFAGKPPITQGPVYWKRDANGYRLPTEAEWEYACRAGTSTAYNSGQFNTDCSEDPNLDPLGRYYFNGGHTLRTRAVGSYLPNAWGLYDMHGNVWEWCWDWYGDYLPGPVTDPTGPETGEERVIRGGGWGSYARYCRSASRQYEDPGVRWGDIGFRVIRPME